MRGKKRDAKSIARHQHAELRRVGFLRAVLGLSGIKIAGAMPRFFVNRAGYNRIVIAAVRNTIQAFAKADQYEDWNEPVVVDGPSD